MTLWEAIVCGVLQGLAEFLPISSSGHLAIAHALFGMRTASEAVSFDVLLHLATLLVVLFAYFREVIALIPAAFRLIGKAARGKARFATLTVREREVILLLLGTVPLAGALWIGDAVEAVAGSPRTVGVLLMMNGLLLLWADHFSASREKKEQLSPGDALGVGVFQLFALFPGISRSGATIAGGMAFGLDRREAVRFSFLLSVPAILGANVKALPELLQTTIPKTELCYELIGMGCALVCGFAALCALEVLASKDKFGFFGYYCMACGALTAIFAR